MIALHDAADRPLVDTANDAPPPRRTRRPVNEGIARRRHIPELVLGLVALVLGIVGTHQIHPSAVGDAGLIEAIGPVWIASLVALCGALVLVLRHREPPGVLIGALVTGAVLLLHGTAPAIEAQPRFFSAYLHAGFIEYVERTGHFLPGLDARFSWPSTFALGAVISKAGGEDLAVWMIRWAPVLFTLACLIPIWVIARAVGTSRRAAWIACALYVTTNWYAQDYLSPQAFALFCYLALIALVIGPFGMRRAARPRTGSGRLRSRITGLRTPTDLASSALHEPTAGTQRALFALVVGLIALIAISHQLTPIVMIGALVALAAIRRTRLTTLWVIALVATTGWFSFGASTFWSGHLELVFGGFGKLGNNVSAGLTKRAVAVSEPRQLMLYLRIALTGIVGAMAAVGALRRWRRAPFPTTVLTLAAVPVGLVGLQSYGGESLLRVGVFATPFLSIAGAFAFAPERCGDHTSGREWHSTLASFRRVVMTSAIGAFATLLGLAFMTARWGNERFEAVTTDESRAISWLYRHAPVHSTLVSASRNIAWRYQDLERYRYIPSGDRVYGNLHQLRGVVAPLQSSPHRPAFFVLSRSQEAFATALYGARPGWMSSLEREIRACSAFSPVYTSGQAVVYRVHADRIPTSCKTVTR